MRITFSVALPPVSLRANNRAHWATKKRDADAYSADIWIAAREQMIALGQHWHRARVTYTWCSCHEPDASNLGGHTKYLQDIIAAAPQLNVTQAATYGRVHLGIVENDRGIVPTYQWVKVAHRNDERVLVEIEGIDG